MTGNVDRREDAQPDRPKHLAGDTIEPPPSRRRRVPLGSLVTGTIVRLAGSWGGRLLMGGTALFCLVVWALPAADARHEQVVPGSIFFLGLGVALLLFEWWLSAYRPEPWTLSDPEDWKGDMAMIAAIIAMSIGLVGLGSTMLA